MLDNHQINISDILSPSQLFVKLANSTLGLIKQYISERFQGSIYLDQRLSEAIIYIQTGQYKEGRDLLISRVLKFDKDNMAALFAMGFALVKLGEVERGLEHFEKVFQNSSAVEEGEQTYFYAALIAYAAGSLEYQKYLRAAEICKYINRIRPDEFEAWAIGGEAFKALNQYENANIFYQKALQLNPRHKISQQGLKECQLLLTASTEKQSFNYTKVRKAQEPPKVSKGTRERIYPSEIPKIRLPRKPPPVDPKYRQEYVGIQVAENNQKQSRKPPPVDPKYRQEYVGIQVIENNQ
ncbi:MAG: hypothetical protein AAGB13_06960 [Cyanobacteria bacterium P01_F01_bin.33]